MALLDVVKGNCRCFCPCQLKFTAARGCRCTTNTCYGEIELSHFNSFDYNWSRMYGFEAGAKQPVHWFLGGNGLGIQQGTSVWFGSLKFGSEGRGEGIIVYEHTSQSSNMKNLTF